MQLYCAGGQRIRTLDRSLHTGTRLTPIERPCSIPSQTRVFYLLKDPAFARNLKLQVLRLLRQQRSPQGWQEPGDCNRTFPMAVDILKCHAKTGLERIERHASFDVLLPRGDVSKNRSTGILKKTVGEVVLQILCAVRSWCHGVTAKVSIATAAFFYY